MCCLTSPHPLTMCGGYTPIHLLLACSLEAEKVREVARIQYDQKVMEKESVKKMSQIEDEAYLARMKAHADADYYTAQRLAEANKVCNSVQTCWLACPEVCACSAAAQVDT